MRRTVFLPSIVLGELFYGALKSAHPDENTQRIDRLATSAAVLSCDSTTALHYGRIKTALRAKSRPIPENDIWIAAIAQQHGLAVVSRDAHFREIDNLHIDEW